jgi:hypothetical protein
MYPYLMDKKVHASHFADLLQEEIEYVRSGQFDFSQQINIYKPRWSWDSRIKEWNEFFKRI